MRTTFVADFSGDCAATWAAAKAIKRRKFRRKKGNIGDTDYLTKNAESRTIGFEIDCDRLAWMRRWIAFFCTLAAISQALGQAAAPRKSPAAASKARPDVFLVTIDTLRADHVGCYGDKQIETPALDS